jgi:hypothetical protein
MIISASRRTDIPAFYSDWFLNRLKSGFVFIRNPFNKNQVKRVSLSREFVDCIVFWSKNPGNMIEKLNLIDEFKIPYYFQFTVTSYDQTIETKLPAKNKIVTIFKKLSDFIGKERIIWRYDPILLTDSWNVDHHMRYFEYLAKNFNGYTKRCVISFIHLYKKCLKNLKSFPLVDITHNSKVNLCASIKEIAESHNITVQTCAVEDDLSTIGINSGKCIDDKLISETIGKKIISKKDKYQRPACNCVESIDVGAYNTCLNHCLYCYANYDTDVTIRNYTGHDPQNPFLM